MPLLGLGSGGGGVEAISIKGKTIFLILIFVRSQTHGYSHVHKLMHKLCVLLSYFYCLQFKTSFADIYKLILKKLKLPVITKDEQHCHLVSVKAGANKTKKIKDTCSTGCNLYFCCLMLWRDLTKVISVLN